MMKTGNLTPRSNNIVKSVRFSGSFGQPDGFSSVLVASVSRSGSLELNLTFRDYNGSNERFWAVRLTNDQRRRLGQLCIEYEPVQFEEIVDSK